MKIKTILSVLMFAGAMLIVAPAFACPVMVKASPRVGSSNAGPVDHVTLYFSGVIDPAKSDLKVYDARGNDVTKSAPGLENGKKSTIRIAANAAAPGLYKVKWHIHCTCGGSKGSVFPGDYSFEIK